MTSPTVHLPLASLESRTTQKDSLSLLELGFPISHGVKTVRDVWKHSSCIVQNSVDDGAGFNCGLSGARGEEQLTFALGPRKSLFLVLETAAMRGLDVGRSRN